MFLGAHTSIAGGFHRSLDRITDLGGNTLMTFASSPRSLSQAAVSPEHIEKYLEKKAEHAQRPHFFHGIYLINLASPSPDYIQASVDSLISYQKLAAQIGGAGTIFHIGSHKGRGFAAVKSQIVSAIHRVLDHTPPNVSLFLENSAGDSVGGHLEELAEVLADLTPAPHLQVCLDTQHLFAAGYHLDAVLNQFDQLIGLKHLGVIHVNDSKSDFASKVDRHANLGEGRIGLPLLKHFLTQVQSASPHLPLILEVPGQEKSGPRKKDLDLLKSLLK